MFEITDDAFAAIVSAEVDDIPPSVARRIENVAIVVEHQPEGEFPRLYGQYRGHPLTRRGVYGLGELPDRIALYQNTMQEHSSSLEELRARVRVTLRHEIGHYFGLDDARLHELGWD